MSAIREPQWGTYKPVEAILSSQRLVDRVVHEPAYQNPLSEMNGRLVLRTYQASGPLKRQPANLYEREVVGRSDVANLLLPAEGSSEPPQLNLLVRDTENELVIARMMLRMNGDVLTGIEKLSFGKSMEKLPNSSGYKPVWVSYDYALNPEGREATLKGIRITDSNSIRIPDPDDGHMIMGQIETSGSFDVMVEKLTDTNIGKDRFLVERGIPESSDLLRSINFWLTGERQEQDGQRILLNTQTGPNDQLLLSQS